MLQMELAEYFPEPIRSQILNEDKPLSDIRFRAGQPVQLVYSSAGDCLIGEPLDASLIRKIALAMMEHSYYACEDDLNKGFFTLKNGCRVGVGGSFSSFDGKKYHLRSIGSLCIRIAREVIGCAEPLVQNTLADEPVNTLILSAPGYGKTTILRDAARILSYKGYRIGIADERHEIAGSANGSSGFDLGPRSDVVDGCPKAMAINMLIRSMAPEVIVTDEIGNPDDYDAIRESARRGVRILASAHASDLQEFEESTMGPLLTDGLFRIAVLLGKPPGSIQEIHRYERKRSP